MQIVVFIIFTAFCVFAKPSLRVGVVNYHPHIIFDKETHTPRGKAIDAIKELLDDKYEISWINIPFRRGEYSLKNDLIDIYTGHSMANGKRESLSYSRAPYYSILPQVCYLKNKGKKEFKNKKLIYPDKSLLLRGVKKLGTQLIHIGYSDNYIERSMKMLKLKRADYFFVPDKLKNIKIMKQLDCFNPYKKKIDVYFTFKKDNPLQNDIDFLTDE